ncbi:hypothetical protein SAMN05216525_10979 [Bradyrhizobium sp. Gha]|nr:hypothetical protein SAMN05216525_10979 [Bradyrhizobium sp. Gha]
MPDDRSPSHRVQNEASAISAQNARMREEIAKPLEVLNRPCQIRSLAAGRAIHFEVRTARDSSAAVPLAPFRNFRFPAGLCYAAGLPPIDRSGMAAPAPKPPSAPGPSSVAQRAARCAAALIVAREIAGLRRNADGAAIAVNEIAVVVVCLRCIFDRSLSGVACPVDVRLRSVPRNWRCCRTDLRCHGRSS